MVDLTKMSFYELTQTLCEAVYEAGKAFGATGITNFEQSPSIQEIRDELDERAKRSTKDVQAIVRSAVQMVKVYVDGTGVFPSGDNLSGMIEAALRTPLPSRKPKWGIDSLRLLFEEARAKAADITKFNHANHFTADEVLKAQAIPLNGLLHEQGYAPMGTRLPAILAAVNGDRFDEFCELLRQV